MAEREFGCVVIGVSAGGIAALDTILTKLDSTFTLPVLVVQHIGEDSGNYLVRHFQERCQVNVKEAEDKEAIKGGCIYFAPPGYHLLVELDKTVSLSLDMKVNFSRPSVDVLFETAAEAYQERLIGVVLTGANSDGAAGLAVIKGLGGLTVVQAPETAEVKTMPEAAIARTRVDQILLLADIGPFLATCDISGEE